MLSYVECSLCQRLRRFSKCLLQEKLGLVDIMNINLLSFGTVVLAAPCCVFYAKRH